ncbi:MAG: hypothetical protein ABI318_03365, partial [Chthoniobacteraceae bacterium]
PPNFVIDESAAEMRLEGEFPRDFTHHLPDEQTSMKFAAVAHRETPDGDKIVLTMRMESTSQEKRILLK